MIHVNIGGEPQPPGAQLERRREQARRRAELDWAELIEVVTSLGDAARAELAAGTATTDPKMLELARQWRALIEQCSAVLTPG
jgi:hypothetical protein